MHDLMRNPVPYRSAAYNDNRIPQRPHLLEKLSMADIVEKSFDINVYHKIIM